MSLRMSKAICSVPTIFGVLGIRLNRKPRCAGESQGRVLLPSQTEGCYLRPRRMPFPDRVEVSFSNLFLPLK